MFAWAGIGISRIPRVPFGRIIQNRPPPFTSEINVLALCIRDAIRRHAAAGASPDTFQVIQIGAYDGIALDPVRPLLIQAKLPGLLVEPQPDVFQRLRQNYHGYSNVVLEQVAISSREGLLPLYRFRTDGNVPLPEHAKLLTSFSRSVLSENAKHHGMRGEIEELHVRALPVMSLLKMHHIDQVGLLQIDTEGYDYEVIKTVDFSRLKPIVINFEDGSLTATDRNEGLSMLYSHGYKLMKYGGDGVAYLQADED